MCSPVGAVRVSPLVVKSPPEVQLGLNGLLVLVVNAWRVPAIPL